MSYYEKHKEERLVYQKQYHNEKKKQYSSYQLSYYHNNKENENYQETRRHARRKFYDKKHRETVERRQVKRTTALKLKMLRQLKRVLKKRYIECEQVYDEPLEIISPEPISEVFKDFKTDSRGLFILDW